MKRNRLKLLVISALLSMGAISFAQEATPPGPYLGPCKADALKFCEGVDQRDERVIGCLKEHRDEVSDSCKARLAQMRVRKPEPRKSTATPATK